MKIKVIWLIISVAAFGAFWLLQSSKSPVSLGGRLDTVQVELVEKSKAAVNQEYVVTVMMDSGNTSVNAAGIYLRFDPERMKVTGIDTLLSFCQLYPEKKFDNNMGTIALSCGSPHPGFKGKSELLKVTFLPSVAGTTTIKMDSKSSILKSDGQGTNLLRKFPNLEVQVGVGI